MSSLSLTPTASDGIVRLSGRTLVLARGLWLLVCISAVILFLVALPYRWKELAQPSAVTLTNLSALGLSSTFFAAYSVFWELIIAVPAIIVGFIIFWRCGEQRVALLSAMALIVFGVASGTITPTIRSLLGLNPVIDFIQHTLEFIAWYSFAIFFYTFPNGHFVPGWTRWAALILLPLFFLWNFAEESFLAPPNWPKHWFIILFLLQFGSWVFSQVYRYRHVSNPIERQQTKWVVYAIIVTLTTFILFGLLGAFIPGYDLLVEEQPNPQSFAFMLVTWLTSPIMVLIPGALFISILRYHLWDIDIVINRTLVYGALTLTTMGIYIVIVGSLGNLIHEQFRSLGAFLATGLVAVSFSPLRDLIQRAVNRMMYGDRDDPYAALARLRHRMELVVATEAILPTIAETAATALKLPYTAVRLDQEIVASYGTKPNMGGVESFPLVYQGQAIGYLDAAARVAGEMLTAPERRLLSDIAHQAGIAIHDMRLTLELQRARERLVTTREEERRRLRRDLHDGLGPKMAGQALILEAVRDSLEPGSPNRVLLDHLIDDSQATVAEIRQLVHGLRPPALDDLGLVGAIRALASQFESGKLHMTVILPDDLPMLPAAVEVAAYRIIQEALTNVVRHAKARACTVRVIMNQQSLEIEISDDGTGLSPNRQAGIGLSSMRERAEEIGGSLRIDTQSQVGTRVHTRLPLTL